MSTKNIELCAKDEEIAQLKALVKQAFVTGWNEGAIGLTDREPAWKLWLSLNPDIKKLLE